MATIVATLCIIICKAGTLYAKGPRAKCDCQRIWSTLCRTQFRYSETSSFWHSLCQEFDEC